MSTLRCKAVEEASKRTPLQVSEKRVLPTDHYGLNVLDRKQMSKYLSKDTLSIIFEAIDKGATLPRYIADHVAAAMKMWAMDMGATHYTHWFQPLTDGTAENMIRL